ncbi:MAG TPA: PAS domain S-box protein [Pyrinomonadaceae bacterium]|nr:PAS domain S-box protein [Pyrinomonadaceae bacterium]
MNPTTAVAFILSSVSLWLLQSENTKLFRTAQACAGVVALVGFIKLCAIVGFFDIGIDRIFFANQLFDRVTEQPNRMAPTTALNFLLLGAALLLLNVKTKRRRDFFPSQYLAIGVMLSSFLAIIGYFYDAKSFYVIVSFNPMAIHTAVSFFVIAVGLLLSKPERGIIKELFSRENGGEMARRLFPLIIIVPAILGWLRLKGEKLGLFAFEIGTAMLVVTIIVILGAIVLNNARLMNIAAIKRRRIEEDLRESELKFRSVAQSANDAIIAADSKGNIISWNNGARQIFGYTEEEALNKSLTVLMPEVYRDLHRKGLERHNATGESHVIGKTVELNGLRKDNSEFPLELSLSSWTTEEKRFYSGVIRDITERKLAEQALEAAALRERALIDNALDVICSIDAEGKFVTVSQAATKVFGFLPAELIGRKYIELVIPEDVAKTNEAAAKIMSGEAASDFENLYRHKNGSHVYVMWSASWSDSQQMMFCVAHDNTERHLADEKLQERERQLKEAQTIARVGSWDWDITQNKIVWSDELFRIFGLTPQEFAGTYEAYFERVHPDDREFVTTMIGRAMNEKQFPDYEHRLVQTDGSIRNIQAKAIVFLNEHGTPVRMTGTAQDITERKMAEEKMKKFAAELQRSNSELQDFASVASHDLQEPLRKIQSFADELKINISHSIDKDDLDSLDRMIAAAGRMRNLINDLLAFSRITSMAKPFVPVDLNSLLKEVLSDLEIRARDSNAQIEAGHLPIIDADPLQMRQLFQNLIGNALKFHRPDTTPIVKISASNGGGNCQLTISDNGIGFDEKYLDRIFTIFQRLHGRNEYEGTGIGLAVCRKIVERHGGELTARSAVGEGAAFIITLPVKQSKQEQ